jgi:hypothetical protein
LRAELPADDASAPELVSAVVPPKSATSLPKAELRLDEPDAADALMKVLPMSWPELPLSPNRWPRSWELSAPCRQGVGATGKTLSEVD